MFRVLFMVLCFTAYGSILSTSTANITQTTATDNNNLVPAAVVNKTTSPDKSSIKKGEEIQITENDISHAKDGNKIELKNPPHTKNITEFNETTTHASENTTLVSSQTESSEDEFNFQNETVNEGTKNYILSKVMFWKDDFLLSIITPIAVGLGAALLILFIIACFKYSKNTRNKRMRMFNGRNIRGDIRKMKHVDRVKLLAASSDDEF